MVVFGYNINKYHHDHDGNEFNMMPYPSKQVGKPNRCKKRNDQYQYQLPAKMHEGRGIYHYVQCHKIENDDPYNVRQTTLIGNKFTAVSIQVSGTRYGYGTTDN